MFRVNAKNAVHFGSVARKNITKIDPVAVPLKKQPFPKPSSSISKPQVREFSSTGSAIPSFEKLWKSGYNRKNNRRDYHTNTGATSPEVTDLKLPNFPNRNSLYLATGVALSAAMIAGYQYLQSVGDREPERSELTNGMITLGAIDPFYLKNEEVDALIERATSSDEIVQLRALHELDVLCHNKVIADRIIQKNILNNVLLSLKGSQNAYTVEAASKVLASLSAIGDYAPELLNKDNIKIIGELCHHPQARQCMGEMLRNLSNTEDSSVRESLVRLIGPLYCLYTTDENTICNKDAKIALHNILQYRDHKDLLQKALNYAYIPADDITELQDYIHVTSTTQGFLAATAASSIYAGVRLSSRRGGRIQFRKIAMYLPRSVASSAVIYLILANTMDYSTEKAVFAKSRSDLLFPSILTSVSFLGAPYLISMFGAYSFVPAVLGLFYKINRSEIYFPKHK